MLSSLPNILNFYVLTYRNEVTYKGFKEIFDTPNRKTNNEVVFEEVRLSLSPGADLYLILF